MLRTVDHDLGDGVVADDGIQQAEAADGAVDLPDDGKALLDGAVLPGKALLDDVLDALFQLFIGDLAQREVFRYILLQLRNEPLFQIRTHMALPLSAGQARILSKMPMAASCCNSCCGVAFSKRCAPPIFFSSTPCRIRPVLLLNLL